MLPTRDDDDDQCCSSPMMKKMALVGTVAYKVVQENEIDKPHRYTLIERVE